MAIYKISIFWNRLVFQLIYENTKKKTLTRIQVDQIIFFIIYHTPASMLVETGVNGKSILHE